MAEEPNRVEPADSEQDEEEDVYEVERIIDMRVEEGEVLYRVRWKNYCSDDDTWEPEAHLEDCREVLLTYKRMLAEAKATKEAEAKKSVKLLPTKSDVFDADSESDSDKDKPTEAPIKKKKKKRKMQEVEEQEELIRKEKKKKKKNKRKEEEKPLPAPETDEEDESVPTPSSPPREKKTELRPAPVDSEDENNEPVLPKKHKKEKDKAKHKKDKGDEERKQKVKKEKMIETSEDEAGALLEDDLSEGPVEFQMKDSPSNDVVTKAMEKAGLGDKFKQKGKWEVKLQGLKDLMHDRKVIKKLEGPSNASKLQKQKSHLSKGKEDVAPLSDSSDGSIRPKKAKSKGQESTTSTTKGTSSSASSSSSSSIITTSSSKVKEDEVTKDEVVVQKDSSGSTNLFAEFLLNCEAKDRAPRRPPAHQPTPEKSSSKPMKPLLGKIEKIPKTSKESSVQKPDSEKTEKTRQSDASRSGQSHGFNLDSDEMEEDSGGKTRLGEESRDRRERPEESQRQSWERRTSSDDKRKKREDSEPRLFIAFDESSDPPEGVDKSEKSQATLNLGMDLNLDWMSLDDFQKHLNGEDEILSGPPLSPSELRDAVKSGDYMAVKLALNSKEDYNLDQEACTIGEKRSFEGQRSLIEDRSSSGALKNSNFEIARKRESSQVHDITPHENIPQELNDPKNTTGNGISVYTASTSMDQVTLSELESIEKVWNDITDSSPWLSTTEQESCEKDQQKKKKGQMLVDMKYDLPKNMDNLDAIASVTGLEKSDDKTQQNSSKQWNCINDDAVDVVAGNSDSTGKPLSELRTEEATTTRVLRHKKNSVRKQPTRSSQRTCRKVLEKTPGSEEEDEVETTCIKHFCIYCKMSFIQLAKHLERKHAEETDVAHAIHFPKESKLRQTLLDQIQKKGEYEHKRQVLKGDAEDVTKKSTTNPAVCVRDFLPCQHCFKFYRKVELWSHKQSCTSRKDDHNSLDETLKSLMQSTDSQMSNYQNESCKEFVQIMNQDDISKHVMDDPLICKFGNTLLAKYGHDNSQFVYIAQQMKELGRFVLTVNKLDKTVKYLHEICLPSKFEKAVEGVKNLCGFDPRSTNNESISLVSKLGFCLKQAAEIALKESRMAEDSETETELKKFIQLLDIRWTECFSKKEPTSSQKQNVSTEEVDTSTIVEDLMKLHTFIRKEEDEAIRDLTETPSLSIWKKLSEAILADVCLFNRGRVGNIGRLLLDTYSHKRSRGPFAPSPDHIRKSTKLELSLCSCFTRVELEGQYGRKVLVLLTERMVSSINLLIEKRQQAGVSRANPYLFARTEGPSFVRALDCFRRAAMECGVKNPEALLSSTPRELISSIWQLMSLCECELDRVAELVGKSCQECYTLPTNASLLKEVNDILVKMDLLPSSNSPRSTKDGTLQKPPIKRKPWSEKEQIAVKRCMSEFISRMKVPGKKECNACIAREPDLAERSWTDVKNFVHNTLQTIRRRNIQHKSDKNGNVLKGSKAEVQLEETNLVDTTVMCGLTTINQDHLSDGANSRLTAASPFSQELTSSYATLCSTSIDMVFSSQPLISSFTPLNATDTQVVPTYSPHNTTNALMPSEYTSENSKVLPLSPLYHNSTTIPSPMYSPQDTTGSPLTLSYTSFDTPSTSMLPTFTQLNTLSASMTPTFASLDVIRPAISSFTPLNHSVTTGYHSNPPQANPTAQVVPTTIGSSVSDRSKVTQNTAPVASAGSQATPADKPQKRMKRLWSEEEQAAVRRQFGDLCKLVKIPGKKDCDACLAAEPLLGTRTWREVKYFVHNSIQSLKRRGHVVASIQTVEPGPVNQSTHISSTELDGPVYLSL
ncbi:M-phase phosphoprotein 8 isoform X1 [Gouania willdenowi]|uniref:M-phase phosphoprotein 8 isoform X1 n=1 Tax=Gouania willdenowi TaxID=441366 RepID=UPI001054CB0D|nr:M-phase phosphoprotein 8 isoform X1 [Gouania willdenowi]